MATRFVAVAFLTLLPAVLATNSVPAAFAKADQKLLVPSWNVPQWVATENWEERNRALHEPRCSGCCKLEVAVPFLPNTKEFPGEGQPYKPQGKVGRLVNNGQGSFGMELHASNRDCRTGLRISGSGSGGGHALRSSIPEADVQTAIDAECMSNCEGVISSEGDSVTSKLYQRGEKANPAAARSAVPLKQLKRRPAVEAVPYGQNLVAGEMPRSVTNPGPAPRRLI